MKRGFFIFLIASVVSFEQLPQSIHFNHLTTENGLSSNYVSDIYQDKTGFLWFATDDGLNRFDGYDFKVYRNNPSDENSISDNNVSVFSEDSNGNMWIGTNNGFVNRYDPVSDKFTKWEIKSNITKENPINVIHFDKNNNVWIGTYRSGLYRLNPNIGKIDQWVMNANDPASLSNNYISSIVEDEFGNYWIGTFYGLNKLNLQKSETKFERYFFDKGNENSLSDNLIWAITQSAFDKNIFYIGTANGITELNAAQIFFNKIEVYNPVKLQFGSSAGVVLEENINGEQILWASTYAGLIRLNLTQNKLARYLPEKSNPGSIASYQVIKIFKDRSGVFWVATNKGLSFFSQKNNKINNSFLAHQFDFSSSWLNTLNATAILKTKSNDLFVGTDNGLFCSSLAGKNEDLKKHPKISKENIWSLAEDETENVWIGTYGSGLMMLNTKNNSVITKEALKNYVRSSSRNYIKSLLADDKNNLWIGMWGGGLAKLNLTNNKLEHFLHQSGNINSISHDDVWIIFQDSKGRIWIGTNGGGLNLYDDLSDDKFYCVIADRKNKNGLNSNNIYSICESRYNENKNETVLWIGTNDGLNRAVIENSSFKKNDPLFREVKHYTTENGLSNNSIKSIVEDDNGNLWLGTSSGISFYDLSENVFKNFTHADGVIGNDFNYSAAVKYNDKMIFLGSTSGLNYFNPADIKQSSFVPPLVITDFQIFNKSVEIDDASPLKCSLFNTDEIILSYKQNVFSFQFAALDYNNPNSISYAYMMEGFDKEWIESGTRRFITYTNLNPGTYTFKVKSTNSDGIWNDNIKDLKVIIMPPWWQTSWAIGLYAIVFILGMWGIVKFQIYRHRLQQELKIQEFEAHHLREIEKMKSKFFANLSHEFRTPLTLIKGPLEQLISGRIKDNLSDYYKMLLRNTEKLQNLIDQLLELSQLEAETIPLNKQAHDLVNLLKSLTYNFKPLAEERLITLSFNSSVENLTLMIDSDKLEKIINNLLSNAFKFTPSGGKISVDFLQDESSDNNHALVKVSDTGAGIPKEYQSKLFDRFFKVEDDLRRNQTGSGIGLALVKELADLHKWEISVESTEGVQTIFTLKIPIEKEIEDVQKQKPDLHLDSDILIENVNTISNDVDQETEAEESIRQEEKAVILFVEDSPDVRSYLQDLLKADYNVLLAESAEDAIEIILKNSPDLIISDLMMPGMDGIEFCNKIKTDWQTSHIPFILLTAKVTDESKIQGLETGADDYLTKPFNYDELFVRIKNLIEQRKRLREKFSKEINIQPASITTNKLDSEFLQKVIVIAEKSISNENFDTEFLAKEMFVSRRQLHRKLQAITGQGPGEFIRSFRLKRAAQLLLENKLGVTQVALEVGFESPAQFTRAFKKYFDVLPSDFNDRARFNPKPIS